MCIRRCIVHFAEYYPISLTFETEYLNKTFLITEIKITFLFRTEWKIIKCVVTLWWQIIGVALNYISPYLKRSVDLIVL